MAPSTQQPTSYLCSTHPAACKTQVVGAGQDLTRSQDAFFSPMYPMFQHFRVLGDFWILWEGQTLVQQHLQLVSTIPHWVVDSTLLHWIKA